jgi:hypothetical protein
LKILLGKWRSGIAPRTGYAARARAKFVGGLEDSSTYTANDLACLAYYLLPGTRSSGISTVFLDEALRSGEFLDFDHQTDSYRVGLLQQRLIELKTQIDQLRSCAEHIDWKQRQSYVPYGHMHEHEAVVLRNHNLLGIMAMYDREHNSLWLSVAIHEALTGDSRRLKHLKLCPPSPHEADKGVEQFELDPTSQEISYWLHSYRGMEATDSVP